LLLDGRAALRPNFRYAPIWTTANTRRATANDALGFGVSGVSITRRWLALSPSSCGGQTHQAISCVLAHDAPPAAEKARLSNVQVGAVIISGSIHSRPAPRSKHSPRSASMLTGSQRSGLLAFRRLRMGRCMYPDSNDTAQWQSSLSHLPPGESLAGKLRQ
jgi:hypothetical protein